MDDRPGQIDDFAVRSTQSTNIAASSNGPAPNEHQTRTTTTKPTTNEDGEQARLTDSRENQPVHALCLNETAAALAMGAP